jgi:2-dehydro-3-deoxyphosphogluconate aldolase/(4S)-4-hydroxy-2-oxoglutarate aldolase
MIEQLQGEFGDQMFIGAGTVLSKADAEAAIEAGAAFLVCPNTDAEVIRFGREREIPVYPGAMTPSEIVTAWHAGAQAVKIFPCASLGVPYIKELQGPLSHIPIIAVGGVNADNVRSFIDAGCVAVGLGSSLINLQKIAAGDFAWVEEQARRVIAAIGQV